MDLESQIRAALQSCHLPVPSPQFLQTLITSRTPPLPLPSLLATAKARLLASDLVSSTVFDPALTSLPLSIDNPQTELARLPRDVHVQVLDVEDLTVSRWEQVLQLEAVARGERTRGREVVRVTIDDDDEKARDEDGGGAFARTSREGLGGNTASCHRLVLQDCKGKKIFGLEIKRIDRVGVGVTSIGEKLLLRSGTMVARGVVLLQPETCEILGGRLETWHKAWVDRQLARLKEAMGSHAGQ